MKRIVLLMLAIVLLIISAVSCAAKLDTLTSDLGVSKSNIVSPDGWVYYGNADGLYRIRPDGTDKTLVLDAIPLIFSIYEDRIYYIPVEKDDRKWIPIDEERCEYISIYSCNTDGSNDRFICETEFNRHAMRNIHFRVIDGWIYIGLKRDETSANSFELYRMSIDGTGMTMISPKDKLFFDYSIDDDGWIYYITDGEFEGEKGAQLWRMHYDGTEVQKVMLQISYSIDYRDNEIYYIDLDDGYIYAVAFFGSEKRKIGECEWPLSTFIKVIGDWVYYLDIGDNPGFYKVRKDGSDLTLISELTWPSYNRMVVRDNWLTFMSEDRKYHEMVRISDMYDTDDLYDLIFEDQLESALRNLDMDDIYDQRLAERYENYETRKYE